MSDYLESGSPEEAKMPRKASRELDFIDFINENADIRYQERATNDMKPRSLLANTSVEDTQNIVEKELLIKYQDTLKQIGLNQARLQEIHGVLRSIHAKDGVFSDIKKQLQEEASRIASELDRLERQLIELEKNPCLQNVIEREKLNLLRERAEATRRELMHRYQESKQIAEQRRKQTEQELMRHYEETRQKTTPKNEQANVQPKQETMPEVHKEESSTKTIKSFFVSIPFSILGLFEFYTIYVAIVLVATLVFWGLSYIPIINTLVDWFFHIRGDSSDILATLIAATLAYVGTSATAEHIINKTRKPTLMLVGIYIAVLNVIFLIVNLINSVAVLPNIIIGIAGIALFYKSKNE